jgi:hypothetical protein
LLGAGPPPKGGLQRRVRAQPPIDLDEAVGPGEQSNERIVEFVDRRVAHGLLRDVDLLADGAKLVEVPQMHPQRRKASVRGAVHHYRRIVAGDTLNHGSRSFPTRYWPQKEEATVLFLSSLRGAHCR